MEATSSASKPYIGPSPHGGNHPRPTNGVELGKTLSLLSGSYRYFLYNICVVFEIIVFCSSVGSVIRYKAEYEWLG